MANFRVPGPICSYSRPTQLRDGTSALWASPLPGILAPDPMGIAGTPEIVFDKPDASLRLHIPADTPAVPRIDVSVRIVGIFPDPTDIATFSWRAKIRFDSAVCPNGKKNSGESRWTETEELSGTSLGGCFSLQFQTLSGGTVEIHVGTSISARCLGASLTGVRLEGTNPSAAQIRNELPEAILWRIVQQESRARQFTPAPAANAAMYPLFSQDRLLGVGLGQITQPPPSQQEIWDWKENLKAVNRKYQAGKNSARRYPDHCRNSPAFQQKVADLNAGRALAKQKAVKVILPDFTADQLERAAVRAYNGCAGHDNLGHSYLHEYRVALDRNGNLQVTVQPDGATALARWEEVPVADRPRSGDPDYVNHVYAQPAD